MRHNNPLFSFFFLFLSLFLLLIFTRTRPFVHSSRFTVQRAVLVSRDDFMLMQMQAFTRLGNSTDKPR